MTKNFHPKVVLAMASIALQQYNIEQAISLEMQRFAIQPSN